MRRAFVETAQGRKLTEEGRAKAYRKTSQVLAFRSNDAFVFHKSWGVQNLPEGSWVVVPLKEGRPTGDVYGCHREAFVHFPQGATLQAKVHATGGERAGELLLPDQRHKSRHPRPSAPELREESDAARLIMASVSSFQGVASASPAPMSLALVCRSIAAMVRPCQCSSKEAISASKIWSSGGCR